MRKAITGLAVVALVAGVALVAVSLSEAPSALAQETEDQVFNRPLDEVLDGLVEDGVITATSGTRSRRPLRNALSGLARDTGAPLTWKPLLRSSTSTLMISPHN